MHPRDSFYHIPYMNRVAMDRVAMDMVAMYIVALDPVAKSELVLFDIRMVCYDAIRTGVTVSDRILVMRLKS